MKKRTMAGGAGVVGLVLLGVYFLGDLFTGGFGLGPGSGTGKDGGGNDAGSENVVSSTEDPETSSVSKTNSSGIAGVNLGKVVSVLIDGTKYKVLKSSDADSFDAGNYRPATLTQIVEMAKKVEGDTGIKVRIAMRGNSAPSAEVDLRNALLNAGFHSTAIYEVEDTVP